ncbi:MAG: FG-GAP-like repeat-containing protein [Pyrinomonadaceae bacterium]
MAQELNRMPSQAFIKASTSPAHTPLAQRTALACLFALTALLSAAQTIEAQSFAPKVDYPVGKEPFQIVSQDFNGDAITDLATVNNFDSSVSVLVGNGDGTFRAAVTYSLTGGAATLSKSLVAADFNGDGRVDLAVSNFLRHSVSVLTGKGDGTFNAAVEYIDAVSGNPYSITAADFNGDGKADLAVGNNASVNVSVLLGRGDGTFQPEVKYAAGSGPVWASAADLNADGRVDLVVSNTNGNSLSVLLGNGDGRFRAAVNYAVGGFPLVNRAADLNGDGKLDLFVVNQNTAFVVPSKNTVSVLVGNGDGTFRAAINYATGTDPKSVATGDFDADGRTDLATADASGTVSVLPGNGDGTFRAAVSFPAGSKPVTVLAGDFNRDGRADLVAANGTTGNPGTTDSPAVSVLLNQTGAFSIGGSVLDGGGAAVPDVTVTLTGSASGVATTAADGSYAFGSLLGGGSYTLTPSKFNFLFAPQSLSFNNLSGNATANFTGTFVPPPTPTPTPAFTPYPDYVISGHVTNAAGAGLADVTVTVSGTVTGTQATQTDAAGRYAFRYAPDFSLIMTPSKAGYVFNPQSSGFVSSRSLSGNLTVDFTGSQAAGATLAPVLLSVPFTDRALAFDSVTMLCEPLPVTNPYNFGADHHTRVLLFAVNAGLLPGESLDALTVRAEDASHHVYTLPVESATSPRNLAWVTQLTVKLPDELTGAGDVRLTLTLRGMTSNSVVLAIKP